MTEEKNTPRKGRSVIKRVVVIAALFVVILGLLVLTAGAILSKRGVRVGEGDTVWNDAVAAQCHDADMGGYKLHYIDIGQGDPVILVHGFASSSYCWHENVPALVDAGFRVILVDQPGLGRSGIPPKPYAFSVENQAGEILKLADRLELKRFSLIGSSMGGGIVLYMSLHHPDRVAKTVVVSPACYALGKHHGLLGVPGVVQLASMLAGRWAIRGSLRTTFFDPTRVDETIVDEYARPFNKPGYVRVLASLGKDFFSEEFERMTQNYAELKPELLILWGDHDKWVRIAFGERLHAAVPGSRYEVLENAGHLPHQEQADAVNSMVVQFLRGEDKG